MSTSVWPKCRTLLYWTPIAIVFNNHFYTIKQVSGRSMQPTLNPDTSTWKDVVVLDRLSIHTLRKYKRGDIVSFPSPLNPNVTLVKRIIALENDTIQTLPPYPESQVKVPPGHIWVEGDEPFRTTDSNQFGPLPVGLLDSKIPMIIWPPDRWTIMTGPPDPSNMPSGPSKRAVLAAIERERWRNSRVSVSTRQ